MSPRVHPAIASNPCLKWFGVLSATPGTLLAYLMEEHGLKQSDLPEVGPQSVVSEILSGKRAPNLRQVKVLAKRFRVPMETLAG
jgi:HTH-type transcriptional regulator/antitoxin HigA